MSAPTGIQHSRLGPEPMPRRDWLGLASLWSAGVTLLFSVFGMMRLPKPAVLASANKKFRVSLPEALAPHAAFVPPGRSVAVFRDAEGVYAISLLCTHLGCVVRPGPDGFECPCHGSRFGSDGHVVKGPALKSLPWLKVIPAGGQWIVDESAMVPPGTKAAL
jgi:cytochrome b6-f complex iron-sulfur subunit